ncbi:MAG: glycosyltransferase family 1 protein, partial [Desulfovibrio sp.]|nr:glycosyltransferase family 1 protein [Desulfovibrio sp.]
MKILITGNQARAMSNFWTVLIRRMVRLGHDLLCVVPADASPEETAWREKLSTLGVRLALYPLDRKGLNPFADIRALCSLRSIIAGEQPDVFFAYTIKPVIYGSLAAALAGAPPKARRFVMITGLGYTFEADSGLKRLLMRVTARLYRTAFARSGTVFFQNGDDRALFERLSIVPPGVAVRLTRGTGVDLEYFSARPRAEGPPLFLFVGRLLEAKGLRDFMTAAALVRRRRPEARFAILGPEEKGPGAVPLAEVLACQDKGLV